MGFIPKPIACPEYGTVYQHQGMLLQNLHYRYLYIVIRLPHLKDLDQKIPSFPNCDNYGIRRASNPNPLNDDIRTNDNELHQQLCGTFKIHYLQEMDIITKVKSRLECKINVTLPEDTAPEYEPVFTSVYQYYGNSLASFTNTIDEFLLQLPILIKLKVQAPMSLFSIETVPVPLDAETYIGDKRVHSNNTGN